MALENYTDLISSINGSGAWMHRTDLATIAPDWVTLAEATINYGELEILGVEGLRTADQETVTTLTTIGGSQSVALPTDFLEMRKVYLTYSGVRIELPQRPIIPVSLDESSNVQTLPRTYSIVGYNMYLYPIPDAAYPITIDYYAKVGPLVTQGTNWLMTKSPNTYLAGAILHGVPWLGAQFNPAPWANAFKVSMGQLARADARARNRLTTMRSDRPFLRNAPANILTGDII